MFIEHRIDSTFSYGQSVAFKSQLFFRHCSSALYNAYFRLNLFQILFFVFVALACSLYMCVKGEHYVKCHTGNISKADFQKYFSKYELSYPEEDRDPWEMLMQPIRRAWNFWQFSNYFDSKISQIFRAKIISWSVFLNHKFCCCMDNMKNIRFFFNCIVVLHKLTINLIDGWLF